MQRILHVVLVFFILSGCQSNPRFELAEPTGAARETLNSYQNSCLEEARITLRSGISIDDDEKSALEGKSTCQLFMDGHPAVTQGNNPIMIGGFKCTSSKFTDLYALCYLKRGYSWREVKTK